MNTKYTSKFGWKAAKLVLYGTLFFISFWVFYALDDNGYYEILSMRTNDLATWSVYSAFFTWILGGINMIIGLTADAVCYTKWWMRQKVKQLKLKFSRA